MYLFGFLEQCEGIASMYGVDYSNGEVQTLSGSKVTLEQILIFFTGTDREPLLGFPELYGEISVKITLCTLLN